MLIENKSFSAFETQVVWQQHHFSEDWLANLSSQMQAKFELVKAKHGVDYINAGDEEANIFEDETTEQLELKHLFKEAFTELAARYNQDLVFYIDTLSRITPMKKYDYKPAHSHADIDAFGVFYINVGNGTGGDLVLHDPRFHNQVSFTSSKTQCIKPANGTLIAAPAYVWHEVSRYLGDDIRLAVICNCTVDFASKMQL